MGRKSKEAWATFAASLLAGYVQSSLANKRREEDRGFRQQELDLRRQERGEDRRYRAAGVKHDAERLKLEERRVQVAEAGKGAEGGFNTFGSNAAFETTGGIDYIVKQAIEAGLPVDAALAMAKKAGAKTVRVPANFFTETERKSLKTVIGREPIDQEGEIEFSEGEVARLAGDVMTDPAIAKELRERAKGFQSPLQRSGLTDEHFKNFYEHRKGAQQQRPQSRPGDPVLGGMMGDTTPQAPQTREEALRLEVETLGVTFLWGKDVDQDVAQMRLAEMGFPVPLTPNQLAQQKHSMDRQAMAQGQHPADLIMQGPRPAQAARGERQAGPMRPGARGGEGSRPSNGKAAAQPTSQSAQPSERSVTSRPTKPEQSFAEKGAAGATDAARAVKDALQHPKDIADFPQRVGAKAAAAAIDWLYQFTDEAKNKRIREGKERRDKERRERERVEMERREDERKARGGK